MLLVLLPNLYWIAVIELACVLMHLGKGDLSFGQVRHCLFFLAERDRIVNQ